MKRSFRLLLALLFIATISCSKEDSIAETTSIVEEIDENIDPLVVPQTKTIEIEILNIINQHREEVNLNKI